MNEWIDRRIGEDGRPSEWIERHRENDKRISR